MFPTNITREASPSAAQACALALTFVDAEDKDSV